jgi:hypothetical protein
MRPSLDRNRAPASRTFKTAPPKERSQHGGELPKPEREGSRSPVKTRPREQPSRLPPSVAIAEERGPASDHVDPESTADTRSSVAAPSRPDYVVSEGDPAVGKPSPVHFSTKSGSFVPTAIPTPDYSEDTPSSAADTRILEKLEKERRARHNLISTGVDTSTTTLTMSTTATAAAAEKLRNGLSFIDRAVQTSHWPAKERGTSALSHALEEASGSCSAWEIYDAYVPPGSTTTSSASASFTATAGEGSAALSTNNTSSIARKTPSSEHAYHYITRVMQRMLFQNLNPDIPADFKVSKYNFFWGLFNLPTFFPLLSLFFIFLSISKSDAFFYSVYCSFGKIQRMLYVQMKALYYLYGILRLPLPPRAEPSLLWLGTLNTLPCLQQATDHLTLVNH